MILYKKDARAFTLLLLAVLSTVVSLSLSVSCFLCSQRQKTVTVGFTGTGYKNTSDTSISSCVRAYFWTLQYTQDTVNHTGYCEEYPVTAQASRVKMRSKKCNECQISYQINITSDYGWGNLMVHWWICTHQTKLHVVIYKVTASVSCLLCVLNTTCRYMGLLQHICPIIRSKVRNQLGELNFKSLIGLQCCLLSRCGLSGCRD